MLRALEEFGASLQEIVPSDFEKTETLHMLGREPFRVDLLTDIPGVTFDVAWKARESVVLDGTSIPLIENRDFKRLNPTS